MIEPVGSENRSLRTVMADVSYTVRTMSKEDIPNVLDVWKETGMQERMQYINIWLSVDPEAFHIAVTDEGEVIGACSACIHHDDLAFVGMCSVKQEYKGLGVGLKVWNACMDHVGDRNVGINAMPEKVKLYRDKGEFPIVETCWVCLINETDALVHAENLSDNIPPGVDIELFKDSHFPLVCSYDHKLVGYNREKIIELVCKEENSRTFVATKDDECVGFGTIRINAHDAGEVGPLYSDDIKVAEVILKKLILSLPDMKGFCMVTVSNNEPAHDFMMKIGCPVTEECPRLYRKEKLDVDFSKVFALLHSNFSPF